MACGNCKGIAKPSEAKMYGRRPWSSGSGQQKKVVMARPRNRLSMYQHLRQWLEKIVYLLNITEKNVMVLVCQLKLNPRHHSSLHLSVQYRR